LCDEIVLTLPETVFATHTEFDSVSCNAGWLTWKRDYK
jgi:hypothetical protein